MNMVNALVNQGVCYNKGMIRSLNGVWGTLILLATPPLALLYPLIFASGFSTFIHWMLAAGALLLALAVFDFEKMPNWLNWTGALLLGGTATIFFLQGLSDLVQNDTLAYFAYHVLGQQLESWSPRLFILLWGGTRLLLHSDFKTRVFGLLAIAIFVAVETYRLTLMYMGASPNEMLKLVIFLPFVWMLFESAKPQSQA